MTAYVYEKFLSFFIADKFIGHVHVSICLCLVIARRLYSRWREIKRLAPSDLFVCVFVSAL